MMTYVRQVQTHNDALVRTAGVLFIVTMCLLVAYLQLIYANQANDVI